MVKKEEAIQNLKEAVLAFDEDKAVECAKEVLEVGADVLKAVNSMGDALNELGDKFQAMEVYLPEVLLASDAFKSSMKLLEPELLKQAAPGEERHKVVIGTVKGDVHAVGKDMVAIMLTVAGYDVINMGVDVDSTAFINTAVDAGAKIIAGSALMTSTLPAQKQIIDFLDAQDLRDKIKVMIGGGPVSKDWAEKINADGFGNDAIEAVEVANKLIQTM